MHEIVVPRLNSNDDSCILVEWSAVDGAKVEDQDPVAVVETSKASADICSEYAGIVQATVQAGAECKVGDVIGYVFPDEAARLDFLKAREAKTEAGPVLTDAARRLSESAGLTDDQLRSLGKRLIRESDIAALVDRPAGLPARQRAIAKVVSRSHQEVPDAFVAMKVRCDAVLDHLRERELIGIPEVALTVLAGLKERFPVFFSRLDEHERLVPPGAETNIGVTIDLGTGLFVPVVKNVGTAEQVADRLMELRVKAMRETFHEDDLSDGQLTLSLNTDPDVIFAVPIILPPQVCIVSLGSVQTELVLVEGQVHEQHHFTAGLTYDHRVINGHDAVEFLTAFKTAIERGAEL